MPTVWIYRDQQVAFVFTTATVWVAISFAAWIQKILSKTLALMGKLSGYREFRRKVILSVAALEYKSMALYRTSEHSWGSNHQGLDQSHRLGRHYRYLPEVELHEAIDEFLFRLSRRQSEGATAFQCFSSRFRTPLSRLETLIAQERVIAKEKRSKKKRDRTFFPGPPSPVPSSLGSSSESNETPEEQWDGWIRGSARTPSIRSRT